MSLTNRLEKDFIKATFTHVGWFCMLVPIYIKEHADGTIECVERNWIPSLWFDIVEGVWIGLQGAYSRITGKEGAPFYITGEIGEA